MEQPRPEFDSNEEWETWMSASSLTGVQDTAPTSLEESCHASTKVDDKIEKKMENEDDILPMEDDWGDSPGTRELFLGETARYVGYVDPKVGSCKDPVLHPPGCYEAG